MRGAQFLIVLALLGCDREKPSTAAVAAPIDARVAVLYDPSMARGAYDVDLSDPVPIQIATLMVGELEPLRRAKMELANDGERGVAAVRRLIERFRDDPAGTDYLRNAADVLSQSPEPSATPLIEGLLDHPSESLRMQALRGLLVHPRAESFDRILQALSEAGAGYRAEICVALGKVDLPRAQRLWLSWIEHGDNDSLWPAILPLIAAVHDPEVSQLARKVLAKGDLDPGVRIWLCAAAAGAGDMPRDEAALTELRRSRESKNPTERDFAVRALLSAGLFGELAWTMEHDDRASLRTIVVDGAAAASDRPEARELLERASNDVLPEIRMHALRALADLGAGPAVDEALQWMESPALAEVEAGMQILRKRMAAEPALALRVWNLLRPRLDAFDARPPTERAMLVKVLGQIPTREASRKLIDLAVARQGDFESMRAQRYILLQSVNAGAGAQDELYELWRRSDDALVRMDAIEAFAALGGDHSRELLIAVLDDPRTTPVEVVYVADRLVRIGPAREVAWQLKRKSLALEDAKAREAVQGILWRWYPAPVK